MFGGFVFLQTFVVMVLFDDSERNHLLPLVFTRPVAELRIGILTISEKWQKYLGGTLSWETHDYLQGKYPKSTSSDLLKINGRVLPDEQLAEAVAGLADDSVLLDNTGLVIAFKSDQTFASLKPDTLEKSSYNNAFGIIRRTYDLFRLNGVELEKDFKLLTKGRSSANIKGNNTLIGEENIFAEPGAVVSASVINAKAGPVYLAADSEIMEGCLIRGGLSLGEHSVLKMGAKIYGPTTIGPHCKVGGEVNNSVFLGYSNKAHDGFLGNSVIGEWCNLGADTNNSNLKNNYLDVKLWNYVSKRFENTGLQFCGLIMGDHSKCGINTMFNTGTVVGISSNIFGSGFPRNFVPSFAWGGAQGFETFQLDKAFEVMEKVMERRHIALTETDKKIFEHIFKETAESRYWEKKPLQA
jgi:UDP-N-acetylglucosamine diphosphorylase/glucosamine-1-phosphate N-acetyltransferase